ncbi:MAG: hypothetical protein HDS62_09840 [Bacteroidales bacterium]|nr:hypothetical protein [Bacteroidales bacterium]
MPKTACNISFKEYIGDLDFDCSTEVSKSYHRGKAASKVKLHSQEILLAQVGSLLAIENAHRNLLDMEEVE